MSSPGRVTTIISTKGQIILPKAIRHQRQWDAGTRLVVEDTGDGVLLTRAPLFPETRSGEVFAMLVHKGEPKSVEEMESSILAEAKRRHAGD